ncbi:NHLP family bacteriocin export ABC transporter peptidase/permease/ATPase subunit [Longimicrobium sp.]|uniref:NHLP family bacteriocin export ABC transporter peptidase/permease/ATPase subunit n=1 Tax=Longimicrobium sp. TaxID=2029185 RepID=UPI002E38212B|nr:NHLP family bacteriocin export ABC transporter peptidase/permease/ATPase subunit [Longimicrobium sp.]HEX6041343.1 NHLP family bacteriocin export ABC transporter peptidase/permease/ATPase subunit [Longimicrobium sp.]
MERARRAVAVLRGRVRKTAAPGRRARVPTVLQMEAVECGAASLAMILAYHRKLVPLEEVRAACGVSRDGSKASNVVKAARGYGLVAKGFKKEPGDLRALPVPMIVHWNFNHFVVLEGFGKGRAFLNDPAHGPRAVSEEEFDQSFTGVALTFERAPEFVPGGEGRSLAAALRRRLAGLHGAVAYVVLAGLVLVLPGLLVPTFSRVFVDDVLVKGMGDWVRPLAVFMAATALVVGTLTFLQQRYLLRLEARLAISTSARFLWHVLHLPLQFFTQRFPGEIASRVGINDRVAQLLSGELATTMLAAVVVVFYALLMVRYDPVLAAVVVATAALNMAALRWVSRRRTDLSARLQQDRGKAIGTAMGGLLNIENLKATGSESDFFARWSGYYAKAANAQHQLALQTTLLSAVPPLLLALSTTLLLGIGGLRVMDGRLSMGMLIAFQALMFAFLAPVSSLVNMGSALQEVRGDMNRLDDVLRAQSHRPDGPAPDAADPSPVVAAPAPGRLDGHLELRRVSFGYSRLEPALIQDFSLDLRPGMRVALVGGSGSGKSTVARIVSGLYEPWAGEVLLDGVPRASIPRPVMTSSFAVVDQEVFLFEGSVRDNLTMWDPTVPEPDLVEAARDACIHDDVSARPGGYASLVEEGGRNFSGGQRQRMEIARALVNRPSVMILDEATSALDPGVEQQIDDNLRRRGCTCLIVAHRLSTIRDCDEIVVMDGGRIVQRGTHDELAAAEGPYRGLIAAE